MVEFCASCGTSLPKGDLTFRDGKLFTSPDYVCPSCERPANPQSETTKESPEPEPDRDLVIRKGKAQQE